MESQGIYKAILSVSYDFFFLAVHMMVIWKPPSRKLCIPRPLWPCPLGERVPLPLSEVHFWALPVHAKCYSFFLPFCCEVAVEQLGGRAASETNGEGRWARGGCGLKKSEVSSARDSPGMGPEQSGCLPAQNNTRSGKGMIFKNMSNVLKKGETELSYEK